MASFSVWDYVVFGLMLIISASIGVYYRCTGGKQKTTKEYLMADRSMAVWPVSFSLMASFMSAVTLLGVSNENYQFGTQFIVINVSYGLATPVAAYLFLPVFYRLQSSSAYEYLEQRFGKATRLVASTAYTVQMVLYMGIALFAPALALEAVTGLHKDWSIILIGVVCTFYSTIGGMKAVLITDVFQSLLMFAAIWSIIIWTVINAGGVGPIFEAASEGGRLEFWNFSLDPTVRHTWWSLVIGGGFTYLSLYAVNQVQVQRLLTVKSLEKAQLALWLNWPILTFLSLSTSFSGLCIYWYYRTCDPVEDGYISQRDQVMPLFVVDAMGNLKGLPGLFVSGIFSACLSSISSAVNSLAAVFLEDYIKPIYKCAKKKPLDEKHSSWISKLIALLAGLLCIGIAFLAKNMGGVLQASLTIFGVIGGPLFGLFTLGMCTVRGNQRGAICGVLLGLAFTAWIGFGGPKPIPPSLPFLNSTTGDCSMFDRNNTKNYELFHLPLAQPVSTTTDIPQYERLMTQENVLPRDEMQPTDYFYLYRLSYLWSVVLGFLVALVVGYIVSFCLELLHWQGEDKVHIDGNKNRINYDLFAPPLARHLKKKQTMNSPHLNGSGTKYTFDTNEINTKL
uniref:CSON009897 protein n=1 Tax=Culicoides sonorensis TaxID=179676 RepID=A0A336M4V5_CULSO